MTSFEEKLTSGAKTGRMCVVLNATWETRVCGDRTGIGEKKSNFQWYCTRITRGLVAKETRKKIRPVFVGSVKDLKIFVCRAPNVLASVVFWKANYFPFACLWLGNQNWADCWLTSLTNLKMHCKINTVKEFLTVSNRKMKMYFSIILSQSCRQLRSDQIFTPG